MRCGRVKPLLSVVVPVYNVQAYLDKCVSSILSQSFTDFELILVDDGSTDDSGKMCEAYAKRDERVRVVHKENGGLVSARKAGLSTASGKYLGIVDSDDWIEPDMYEDMVTAAEEDGLDMVYCHYWVEALRSTPIYSKFKPGLYTGADMENLKQQALDYEGSCEFGIAPAQCNKLFLREKYSPFQIQADNGIKLGEDVAVTVPYLICCESVRILERPYYHYRMSVSSITHSYDSKQLEKTSALLNYLYGHIPEAYSRQLVGYSCRMLQRLVTTEAGETSDLAALEARIRQAAETEPFPTVLAQLKRDRLGGEWRVLMLVSDGKYADAARLARQIKEREQNITRIKNVVRRVLRK